MHITDKPIEFQDLIKQEDDPACGAQILFVGKVRNHHKGKSVKSLTYECYAPMAEKEISHIIAKVKEFHGIPKLSIFHRIGELNIGEAALVVIAESAHRKEAFDACQDAIDRVKSKVPIWKKEHYTDGTSSWVSCHDHEEVSR